MKYKINIKSQLLCLSDTLTRISRHHFSLGVHRCRLTMQRRWPSPIGRCLLSMFNMILHFCFPLFVHYLLSLVNMFPHICFASFLMNDEKLSLTKSMNIYVTFLTYFTLCYIHQGRLIFYDQYTFV